MNQTMNQKHTCYRCVSHEVQGPFRQQGHESAPALDSVETTFSEGGDEIFYASGYSAREIAQKHAKEHGGQVYVNNISRNIKRRDLSNTLAPVFYAVAKSPIYTLRAPDALHETVYRAYWPPLQ
ncbi:hypothetical protein [Candidatus Nitrospira bockiana]